MPDIEIVKLKLRRGTDTQRTGITLEQGELGYTTDAKRVWVGDGFTVGGNVVGNVAHTPLSVGTRTDLSTAVTGDIVYEDNLLYQLSGTDATTLSSWGFIGSRPDDVTVEYNGSNHLHIIDNSITPTQLASSVVATDGGIILNPVEGLSANVDGTTITINGSGQLETTHINISASDIGQGLSGGSGDPIGVYATDSFTFDGDRLEINQLPANTVDGDAIQSAALGTGLVKSGSVVQLETIGGAIINPFNTAEYDSTGRMISTADTIEQNLSGTDVSSGYFGSFDAPNPSSETIFEVLSANSDQSSTATVAISSAGFIKIASGSNGDFAIPVFKLPTI